MFYSATEITKADFFAIFDKFSKKTFTSDLCKAAFRKAGLILYNPSVILEKMKDYGGQQRERSSSVDSESTGFVILPLPLWHEFTTLITNTGRRRGA